MDRLLADLAQEPNPRRRRQLLQARADLWRAEDVSRFYDEVVRLLHVNVQQAERIARAAFLIAERLGEAAPRAAGLRALGHVYYRKRKYETSLDHYQQSLELYRGLGDPLEAGRTLNSSLQSLIYLGRYAEAMDQAPEAREIFERAGDRLRLARLDANVGNILYRQDRFEEALELYQRAYDDFRRNRRARRMSPSRSRTPPPARSASTIFREALATYQKARVVLSCNTRCPLLVAVADYNIAYLYYLRGEYTRSIELYRAAREDCRKLGDTYREALCDLDQSEMYLELNLSEEGAYLAGRAQKTFLRLGMGYEAAKAQTNLAISLTHHGQLADGAASSSAGRGSSSTGKTTARGSPPSISTRRWCITGKAAWTRPRTLRPGTGFLRSVAAVHQERRSASCCWRASIWIAARAKRPGASARLHWTVWTQAETPALSYQAWFVLGVVEEALGAPAEAHQAYLKAHEHLENLRSHLKAEEMKIAFLKDKLEVYEALVRMCLRGTILRMPPARPPSGTSNRPSRAAWPT